MLVLTSNTTFVITRLDDKLDHKTSYKYKKKRKEKKKVIHYSHLMNKLRQKLVSFVVFQ